MFLVVQEKNDIILFVVGFLDRVTKAYMEKFGKEMIGYCGGLPLAITVLGGLLAAKQTQEECAYTYQIIPSCRTKLKSQQSFNFKL